MEIKVDNILNSFYNVKYSPEQIARKETDYYVLVDALKKYKNTGGDLDAFKSEFLFPLFRERVLKEEQEDFIFDLINIIEGICSVDEKI
ncbi:hypothetical protein P8625_04610 [Tenacibaculum tangerinum]|uniref:Uncharacterized protein n=1 Tax=Tenacibaculum tangerinum TaxID=3038772 RepID=A0ABY8L4V2_9FLAO|nr:hypothetical protein [Tenacibaculum tangerinum]WGH76447.1 hypothetical protein P8625_04610 [Tenacibaculum tangerinum]